MQAGMMIRVSTIYEPVLLSLAAPYKGAPDNSTKSGFWPRTADMSAATL
jgi:hypothetical protein